jgi:ATP-dependent DNA helicase RecQ
MTQFKAGYILDIIANEISSFEKVKADKYNIDVLKMQGLLKYISSFEVAGTAFDAPFEYEKLNPFLATINNIITRGLPTRAPVIVEEKFAEIIKATKKNEEKKSEINYVENDNKIDWNTIFEILHFIEPKLNITKEKYLGNLGSQGEWDFINNILAEYPFCKQILQSQRPFTTITNAMPLGTSVDFSYEIPYLNIQNDDDGKDTFIEQLVTKGIIFEFDGKHHKTESYKAYDVFREEEAVKGNFAILRQPSDLKELDLAIIKQFDNKDGIFEVFARNYNTDITERLAEQILVLTPFAIARIQKTLLELFLRDADLLSKLEINIAIIERDLPCGALAIESLNELASNLSELITDDSKLPKFNVIVYPDQRFSKHNLHRGLEATKEFDEIDYDIILDHSLLIREGIYKYDKYNSTKSIKIRSSHFVNNSFGNKRRVYCAKPLDYKELVIKQPDATYLPNDLKENIEYFIQNIFRKPAFREGQLEIISRALRLLPVIGLLPTGGGKSLTFQLSALMQPGICIVVDPIKTLMEDQVRVLKNNWIDCCDYINSTLTRKEKRNKQINFRFGESQIMFLSPERFVMNGFRNLIQNINSLFDLSITYCVIDEVHCVSEWGHNFRFTYLQLGKNAQQYCFTKNETENKKVTLIGLTATASFDVLADVERELKIEHSDLANALIMSENTIRPEMFYRVIDATLPKTQEPNKDLENIGNNLQYWNQPDIIQKSLKQHIANYNSKENATEGSILIKDNDLSKTNVNDHSLIVFCSTKSTMEKLAENSVCEVYNNFKSESKGYFFGSSDEDEIDKQTQFSFEKFITGNLKHIVATKAFGMGIDKEDVRAVYHINYSNSLESFVQEAGRAGRDKQVCESVIIYRNQNEYQISNDIFTIENYNNIKYQFFKNITYRNRIRWNFVKDIRGITEQEVITKIDDTKIIEPATEVKLEIKEFLKSNIITIKPDRNIHEFFYNNSNKGIETEKAQINDIFDTIEIEEITLKEKFVNSTTKHFNFIVNNEKKRISNFKETLKILNIILPINFEEQNKLRGKLYNSINYSNNWFDFILQLEETTGKTIYAGLNDDTKQIIEKLYLQERSNGETDKLIYRMVSMGLVEDYTIDYTTKQINCTFINESEEYYLLKIEEYLRKYLSETSTIIEIEKLEKRLSAKQNIIEKIKECLFYLTEFAIEQIGHKQLNATNEIESVISNASIINDKYEQNYFIKEEIFYYFNAKYARIGYKIGEENFSLNEDYKNEKFNGEEILYKYLGKDNNLSVFKKEGTEQNNYKQMRGSCKKILASLATIDFENDWVLRLLKAFSMYSVNNPSYISEANEDLEMGFKNLYTYYKNDFEKTQPIFNYYFERLLDTIKKENELFNDINMVRLKILIEMQIKGIDNLLKPTK